VAINNSDLDNPRLFKQYDADGMLDRIHEMPGQCQQAWQMALDFELPPAYAEVERVVILGMGGSAIGGDIVRSLTINQARLPIFICRDYELPAFVDGRTLVIASSYSGMTEETLSAFEQSLRTDAPKLVITTGGKLETIARSQHIPVFRFDYRAQPRAALPFSLFPILCFCHRLGFIPDMSANVVETLNVLPEMSSRINENVPLSRNQAKQLASQLYGRLPVVYGADFIAAVAHRWKTQLNENGKSWAFYEVFPELNHNAVAGYQFPPEVANKVTVVMLHSDLLPERLKIRYRVTAQLLDSAGVSRQQVEGEGQSQLSHIMSLVLYGDYTSYYLALLNRIDPTPVKNIEYVKEHLRKEKTKW